VCPASRPGKKAPGHFSLFFFSFLSSPNKQKAEHQSESNPKTSWTPRPRKPPYGAPHWKQQMQKKEVSITHHVQLPSHPPTPTYPGKIIQHSPWANWTHTHTHTRNITEKHKHWTHPGEQGRGKDPSFTAELSGVWQGTELSALNSQWHAIKQKWLTTGTGQQDNNLEEPPAPSRDQERHTG
jgi:hypothetical protein